MPEGPEVKKVVDFLRANCLNKSIVQVKILSGRYTKKPIENLFNRSWCPPIKIKDVDCKGKFIYFSLQNDVYLFNTLGMTGTWSKSNSKHARVEFVLDDESSVYFTDMRNFGTLKFVLSKLELTKKLKSIGPDFLRDGFDPNEFYKLLHKNGHKTIAQVLMDQKVVSGIGNYLKAECLYAAKISPHRFCCHINEKESNNLFHACKRIIRLSYEMGGATLSTYRQPNGEKGLYSRRFAVYNQKQDPDGYDVIKEKTLDKRTTHWVPNIQK